MILSTMTNEVLPDFAEDCYERIFAAAAGEGVTNFEVRRVAFKRFPHVDARDWDQMKRHARTYGITFSTVTPGLFLVDLHSDLLALHRDYLVDLSLDLAERIDVRTLIAFGVYRHPLDGPDSFERVVDLLRDAAETAAARGCTVQLENLPGTWADSSANCLALLEAVDHPAFGYIWDTGNLYEVEQTHFRAGYDRLKPYIRNVHLKDGRIVDGRMTWQHFGEGVTDIRGQVAALKADDYRGTITLEAKLEPHGQEDFFKSVRYLRSIL